MNTSMVSLLLPAFLALLLVTQVVTEDADDPCTTSNNITHCHGVTSIPADIPISTTALYIVKSSLGRLSAGAFARYEHLTQLVLLECEIESIQLSAFSGLIKLTSLDLKKNKIKRLQSHVFNDLIALRKLELRYNNIRVIEEFAFHGLTLHQLSLEDNPKLATISDKAFHESSVEVLKLHNSSLTVASVSALKMLSSSIRELWLQNNRLPLQLPADIFEGFQFLVLNLKENGIGNTDFLEQVTCSKSLVLRGNPIGPINFTRYSGLRQIQELDLDNTDFHEVSASYFSSGAHALTHLRKLSLSDNGITSLPEAIRQTFNQLEWLNIEGNPLHCNCELVWLKRWVMTNDIVKHQPVYCLTPRAENIIKLAESYMSCSSPDILHGFQAHWNVSVHSKMSLTCIGEGDPAPTLEWQAPGGGGRLVVDPPTNRSEIMNQAVFHIAEVSAASEGVYTCHAYNPAGNVSANVTLTSFQGEYKFATTDLLSTGARLTPVVAIPILTLLIVNAMS